MSSGARHFLDGSYVQEWYAHDTRGPGEPLSLAHWIIESKVGLSVNIEFVCVKNMFSILMVVFIDSRAWVST